MQGPPSRSSAPSGRKKEHATARVTDVVNEVKAKVGARGEGPSSKDRQEAAKQTVRKVVNGVKGARRQARGEQPPAKEAPPKQERQDRGRGRGGDDSGGGSYRAALMKRRSDREAKQGS